MQRTVTLRQTMVRTLFTVWGLKTEGRGWPARPLQEHICTIEKKGLLFYMWLIIIIIIVRFNCIAWVGTPACTYVYTHVHTGTHMQRHTHRCIET